MPKILVPDARFLKSIHAAHGRHKINGLCKTSVADEGFRNGTVFLTIRLWIKVASGRRRTLQDTAKTIKHRLWFLGWQITLRYRDIRETFNG
jgi:hypothetical protein